MSKSSQIEPIQATLERDVGAEFFTKDPDIKDALDCYFRGFYSANELIQRIEFAAGLARHAAALEVQEIIRVIDAGAESEGAGGNIQSDRHSPSAPRLTLVSEDTPDGAA